MSENVGKCHRNHSKDRNDKRQLQIHGQRQIQQLLTAARRGWGRFFSFSRSGHGAAVSGMRIEINTGYRRYMTAARGALIFFRLTRDDNGIS